MASAGKVLLTAMSAMSSGLRPMRLAAAAMRARTAFRLSATLTLGFYAAFLLCLLRFRLQRLACEVERRGCQQHEHDDGEDVVRADGRMSLADIQHSMRQP